MEEPSRPNITFHPIISSIQKIALYETKSRFYLIGSNITQSKFRVLKIDRMEPRELMIVDDKTEYTKEEIKDLVKMIDVGNRSRIGQRNNNGAVARIASAFGIIGNVIHESTTCEVTNEEPQRQEPQPTKHKPTQTRFSWNSIWQRDSFPRLVPAFALLGFVRFLEGYYIILVTKRRRVAVIGHHTLYKNEDTAMIYIPNDSVRLFHHDEQRYVKMFQSIDLSSNFYFSYSYDLTQTLQINMAPPRHIKSDIPEPNNQTINENDYVEDSEDFFNMWAFRKTSQSTGHTVENINYGVRSNPNRRFVWNSHLLLPAEKYLHPDWILYITHGFIGQSNISIFGKCIYVTLIARRSTKYAGTRFLKRGANFDGDVANEVETEQIVHDSGVSSFSNGRFSSFVQMRGSVPGHWSQDVSKMVPKPTITCDLTDPYFETAGAHFNQLLKRYGSPIIILNLVKQREKKKHESTLSEELGMAVKYLNQFLPTDHQIVYISFDMARMNKGKKANVMGRLANIAHGAVLKTGIFQSQNPYYSHQNIFSTSNTNKKPHRNDSNSTLPGMSRIDLRTAFHSKGLLRLNSVGQLLPDSDNCSKTLAGPDKTKGDSIESKIRQCFARNGSAQTGIIRTNCVDCLDRTNTAQFAIGKYALGFQLCALGVLETPKLEFDSDCVRLLEELYEDHGDTLALQYGGSQLVHRIKTYRKTAPWTSQGNDIMQTLSRYFSNTFSDQEKQHTINLFLGLFHPEEGKLPLWEYVTDYYLHHKPACKYRRKTKVLTQWWGTNVLKCLPYALAEVTKSCSEMIQVQHTQEEMIDVYYDYHRPHELSVLDDVYAYKVSHSVRDFMPHSTTDFSPFAVRVRPGRRREGAGNKHANMRNPSMTGQSSTSSAASSASSSMDSSSDDDESHQNINDSQLTASKDSSELVSFESLFPSMLEVYGTQPEFPNRTDILLYKRYVLVGRNAICTTDHSKLKSKLAQQASFSDNTNVKISLPIVKGSSMSIYEQYVKRGKIGGSVPNPNDLILYENYVQEQMLAARRCGTCKNL